ncbi:hypothetical protein SARC_12671 [Sphaeroforma arctica JP610]|uniref:Uncharacterized protein n=1 Tax=Sphaeroforma arctica JP610 TaxID=667725 RepID=A0A0L0FDF8_9EUKA|nr:hypothetical protein SARC_12671 [Sphaeroforma arctica JP610]KNC74790.1 hypothetical protein SARC_12671 [Sphaeroforma arctica JP610]|eukprot:XP_014148692.1 hypothetical protein SARC_12671 [Sphaeroforma arctica JP610]
MNLTAHVTMGCRAHRIALVMKKLCGRALITATDKMRVVFNDKQKGLHKHKLKKQLNILEALICAENEEAMKGLVAPKFDSKPISNMIEFCAQRAAYFNKSTVEANKLVQAHEMLLYDNLARAIANGGVRWSGVYEMIGRNDYLCTGIMKQIEDSKEDDKHTG